jgi:hypothetical protein
MKKLFGILLLVSFVFSSCEKEVEEKTPDACATITTIGTAIVERGEENLVIAQLAIYSGLYAFQLSSVSSDCLFKKTISLSINKSTGSIGGTYEIKDFFNADENDAYGSYVSQDLSTRSEILQDLVSGTVTITEHGPKDYTVEIIAVTAVSGSLTFKVRHKF